MGKAIRASVLVLLLACSAQAGYMQNDVTATPGAVQGQAAYGIRQNEEPGSLTESVLSVLGSVLALF